VASADQRLSRLIGTILQLAAETLGADAATLSVAEGEVVSTVHSTDPGVTLIDQAQYEQGDGPCLHAIRQRSDVEVSDFSQLDEERWAAVREAALELGVRSSFSLPLRPEQAEEVLGSLNLYAREQRQLSSEEKRRAALFATQLATALVTADAHRRTAALAERLAEALTARAVIDQAVGIVVNERGMPAAEAMQELHRRSEAEGVSLQDVAQRLVDATQR
jgi:transcriptional regulator with GAF, ATPase, and Fis domain